MKSLQAAGTFLVLLQSTSCLGRLDVGRVAGGDAAGTVVSTSDIDAADAAPSGYATPSDIDAADAAPSGYATPSDAGAVEGGSSQDQGSIAFDAMPAPPGLASFAFVVNGAVQTPMTCPSNNWEYPEPAGEEDASVCAGIGVCCAGTGQSTPLCPGVTSVVLINTGELPLAYTAQRQWDWNGGGFPPGVDLGVAYSVDGVLSPGAQADITSEYVGGVVAVLGSAEPFSNPDAGRSVMDEGTIPWPAGVTGSGGATQMQVAEIQIAASCGNLFNTVW